MPLVKEPTPETSLLRSRVAMTGMDVVPSTGAQPLVRGEADVGLQRVEEQAPRRSEEEVPQEEGAALPLQPAVIALATEKGEKEKEDPVLPEVSQKMEQRVVPVASIPSKTQSSMPVVSNVSDDCAANYAKYEALTQPWVSTLILWLLLAILGVVFIYTFHRRRVANGPEPLSGGNTGSMASSLQNSSYFREHN